MTADNIVEGLLASYRAGSPTAEQAIVSHFFHLVTQQTNRQAKKTRRQDKGDLEQDLYVRLCEAVKRLRETDVRDVPGYLAASMRNTDDDTRRANSPDLLLPRGPNVSASARSLPRRARRRATLTTTNDRNLRTS